MDTCRNRRPDRTSTHQHSAICHDNPESLGCYIARSVAWGWTILVCAMAFAAVVLALVAVAVVIG